VWPGTDSHTLTSKPTTTPPATQKRRDKELLLYLRLPSLITRRRRRAATLDLTTVLTTRVTTVAVPATPPTRPFAADLAWLLRLPAPGSVGVGGSSPLSSTFRAPNCPYSNQACAPVLSVLSAVWVCDFHFARPCREREVFRATRISTWSNGGTVVTGCCRRVRLLAYEVCAWCGVPSPTSAPHRRRTEL
jgi:hypothetical protein